MLLTDFISRKNSLHWEDATVDDITADDLDDESFKIFRSEALRRGRMSETEVNVSNEEILQKLHLIKGGKLTRSAVLLFYRDPSIIQNGSFIKIGKFDENDFVTYHHELSDSLIVNASKVIDLICLMYLRAKISYEHDRRVEEYPFARHAIREAVYNAIAHNCYMYGTPIQIRITEESLSISNRCILPEGWTVDTFMKEHDSITYNPGIANVFYRAGFIENWGQGISKICKECSAIGAELPKYELLGTTLRVTFRALERAVIRDNEGNQNGRLNDRSNNELEDKILQQIKSDNTVTVSDMAAVLAMPKRTIEREIQKLRDNGRITREGSKKKGWWKIN